MAKPVSSALLQIKARMSYVAYWHPSDQQHVSQNPGLKRDVRTSLRMIHCAQIQTGASQRIRRTEDNHALLQEQFKIRDPLSRRAQHVQAERQAQPPLRWFTVVMLSSENNSIDI